MPQLDVSFMTSDPMLADTFRVTRRVDAMLKGRTVITPDEIFEDVVGVITWMDQADLIRLPDMQYVPRLIRCATSFALRGASKDADGNTFQPDLITYLCEQYAVTQVLPYSRFGGGTYEVVATSMTAMDKPIDNSS